MEFVLKKKGIYNIIFSENEECLIDFNDWYCHYGIEKFKSKYILNLNINDDNSGHNLKNFIKQIYNKINEEKILEKMGYSSNLIFFNPIKKNKYNIYTVRLELDENIPDIEPKSQLSGVLHLSDLWIWDNNYGIKIYLKNLKINKN